MQFLHRSLANRRIALNAASIAAWIALTGTFAAEPEKSKSNDDQPPETIARLLDGGSVSWRYYDPSEDKRRYPGRTEFQLAVRHKHLLKFDVVRRAGERRAVIEQRLDALKFTLTHTIELPQEYDTPRRWERDLVLHELDHVAISTDPRPRQLIRYLYEQTTKIEVPLDADEALDGKLAQNTMNDHLDVRLKAVIAVINWNNRLLDRVSDHGNREIPECAAFFERLYTKPNLDEAEFPFTGQVLELLKSEKYRRHVEEDAAGKPAG